MGTHEDLVVKYRVQTVPTFILFKAGEAVWGHSGMVQGGELRGIIGQYTVENEEWKRYYR